MSTRANDILPSLVIGRADHTLLTQLASAGAGSSDELLTELERAEVVEDQSVPANVVRMGSVVGYSVDGGEPTTVTLVYPEHADISAGRISVLTPVGTALIGLRPGQSIEWSTRDGTKRKLTVITVFSGQKERPGGAHRPMARSDDLPDDPGPAAA